MFRRAKAFFGIGLSAVAIAAIPLSVQAQTSDLALQDRVDQARADYNLVGLGAAVITADMVEPLIAVTGERRRGSGDVIQIGDAWHIGSNTKMLTALTYATLVSRDDAEWAAKLPDLFPDIATDMQADWHDVTIEDLFAHRSGAAPNISQIAMIARVFDERNLTDQRAELVVNTLTKPSSGTRGEFEYSNLGYIIAGAAIEAILNSPSETPADFETLFLSIFGEDIADGGGTLGFGPPKDGIQGHMKAMLTSKLKAVGANDTDDNPAIFGPAGTMNIDLRTHALFLAKHFISGEADIKAKLLTPYPEADSDYALGWGLGEMEGIGQIFGHSGSNTMWLSNVTYAPSLNAIVIINTNQFNDDARNAVRDLNRDILNDLAAKAP